MSFCSRRIPSPAWHLRIVLAALALALSSGCGRKAPEPGTPGVTRVAILADNVVNPMRNYQTTLLEMLIRTRAHMEVSTVHAGGDADVQIRQVREAVQARARFLMVFPQDAATLSPALREAVVAGLRVFVFSPDVPYDACTCAIFTDDRRLGQFAGEYIVAALTTKAQVERQPVPQGRIVMLRGDEGSAISSQRAEAFLAAVQPHPGIVLVHDAPCDWNEKAAADRTREALRIQKKFDVIYAHSDLIAFGASRAVRETGTEARDSMLILGTDGVPGNGAGVSMVLRGDLDATVYHPPLVDAAWRQMQTMLDQPAAAIPKRISVKPFIITPENAARIQREGLPLPDIE